MGKFGLSFSWKRAVGITAAKRKISRATGVPLSRGGRQQKLGKATGCLLPIVVLVIVVCLTAITQAQRPKEGRVITEWIFVSEGSLVKSYIAPATIKRGDDIIKVWMKFELPHGSRDLYANTPKDYGEVRVYGLIDCAGNRMQAKTMLAYDRSGTLYAGKENIGAWAEEQPNSISHNVFLYFCERGEKPIIAPTLKPK